MCSGNRASMSTLYINKQLETLWQIALDCALEHNPGLKPASSEIEYSTSLVQLCVGKRSSTRASKQDLTFFATFGTPQVKFICNHEVILQLHLTSGYDKEPSSALVKPLGKAICSFRVDYQEHTVAVSSQQDSSKSKMLILNLDSAIFCPPLSNFARITSPESKNHQRIIVHNLQTHYLPLLHKAGFHRLYSLPDFDDLPRTLLVDYSLLNQIDLRKINFPSMAINAIIRRRWLEATMRAQVLDSQHEQPYSNQMAISVHCGISSGMSFYVSFGPLYLQGICSQEVLLLLDVQEVKIYHGAGKHAFRDWTIAIVMDVHVLTGEQDNSQMKLDFSTARFCEARSQFDAGMTVEEPMFSELRSAFIEYITEKYLPALDESQHGQMDRMELRILEAEESAAEDDPEDLTVFTERIFITDTFGFDVLTTVAQGSINNYLRTLWSAGNNCLSDWRFEKSFHASFGPPQIELLCDSDLGSEKVILYIDVREGFLTTLGVGKTPVGGKRHEISGIRLAFEVTAKLREFCDNLPHPTDDLLEAYGNAGTYVLKQLVLVLSTAIFRQDRSRISRLLDGDDFRPIKAKSEALQYFIVRLYFAQLKEQGYHVLYNFPAWMTPQACGLTYAPSSFSYQFYSAPRDSGERQPSDANFSLKDSNRNMLVVCGVIDKDRRPAFPFSPDSWSLTCTGGQTASFGTVALSRAAFLDGWLLPELTRINGRTTLIPVFDGVGEGGEMRLELVAWEKSRWNKDQACAWKEVDAREIGGFGFEWKNKEEWNYTRQGGDASSVHNGVYTVSCGTHNTLHVPTVSGSAGCEIKLSGRVELTLSFTGDVKTWATSATAKWNASLIMANSSGVLELSSSSSFETSSASGFTGDYEIVHPKCKDATTLLAEQFIQTTIVETSTIETFESALGRMWPLFYAGAHGYTLCDPSFNKKGDLLLHLKSPVGPESKVVVCKSKNLHIEPLNSLDIDLYEASLSESSLQTPAVDSHPLRIDVRQASGPSRLFEFVEENIMEEWRARIKSPRTYDASEVVGFQASSFSYPY